MSTPAVTTLREAGAVVAIALTIRVLTRRLTKPMTPKPSSGRTPEDVTKERARIIARRDDYKITRIVKVLDGADEAEVLFLGRYLGNSKAGIPGDSGDTVAPFRAWVKPDATGYITAGW